MSSSSSVIAAATSSLWVLTSGLAGQTQESAPLSAENVIERSADAYRQVAALEDTLVLTVEIPNAEPGERIIHYNLGRGSDASLYIEGNRRVTAAGNRLFVESDAVDGRFMETEFSGDFAVALDAIAPTAEVAGLAFRSVGLWEPPQIAMRAGKSLAGVSRALRLTPLLDPLEIAGYRRLPTSEHEIRLDAVNGSCTVRFDPESFFLTSVDYVIRPSGLSEDFEIRARGRYSPRPLVSAEGVVQFEPGTRSVVANMSELRNDPPGIDTPPAELISSDTLEGSLLQLDQLAESLRSRRVLLVGEDHFLEEPQAYLVGLMERLDDRPIRLLLELPADAQPDIDRYLDGCDEGALQAIFEGRQALPLHHLLRWSCANRKRLQAVTAMDEILVEILLRRMFLGDTRNQTMATAIWAAYESDPEARVVAYAGQMHMIRAGRYLLDHPSREPAGSRLGRLGVPPEEIASLVLGGGDEFHLSEIWDTPGALLLEGELARIPFPYFVDYPIFGVDFGSELFDYFVHLGPLTPIPRD